MIIKTVNTDPTAKTEETKMMKIANKALCGIINYIKI